MLTRKEQQTFDFITKYHKKFGEPPLLRQIAEGIGIKSKGVAHRYVEALVKERKIKKFPYRHRGNIINQKKSLNGLRIKSFGKIVAGSPIDAVSDKDIIELDHIFSNEKCFALKVQGNSMIEAGINDGDTVIVKKTDTAENGKIVVALIDDQEAMLKRIRRKGKTVALESANRNYETKIFGPDRVKVQGILVSLYRNFH